MSTRSGRLLGLAAAAVVLMLSVIASLAIGSRQVDLGIVLGALSGAVGDGTDRMVVLDLRVPRTIIGLVAGAALALAGTVMQGLTRNPLADPGLLGVNAGASLFVVIAITFFGFSTPAAYIWFALLGAAVATVVVYVVGSGKGGATPLTLTIAGAAVTAALTSLINLVLLLNIDTLNQFRFWSVGSLVARDLGAVSALAPVFIVGAVLALVLGRGLNAMAMGDDVATGLGHNLGRTRVLAAVAIIALCGGATAIAGPVVFVGLVIPHIVRRIVGSDYRWVLAYGLVLGPILLIAADIIGRLIVPPGELEAGLVVAFLGAPVMIALVRRSRAGAL